MRACEGWSGFEAGWRRADAEVGVEAGGEVCVDIDVGAAWSPIR